jgi:hypothetical protein
MQPKIKPKARGLFDTDFKRNKKNGYTTLTNRKNHGGFLFYQYTAVAVNHN